MGNRSAAVADLHEAATLLPGDQVPAIFVIQVQSKSHPLVHVVQSIAKELSYMTRRSLSG